MTKEEFLATQFPGLAEWIRVGADVGTGSRVFEREGIVAQVSPAVPDASLFNSVTYRDPESLRDALPELASVFAEAGVRAWTVWAHESDVESGALLGAAGHLLDGTPEGMGCALEDLIEPDGVGELDYTDNPDAGVLQSVLARGYGFPLAMSERVAAGVPSGPGTIVAVASLEGRPACTAQVTVVDGDAGIYAVATIPEARGRGLARRLQFELLRRARELGAKTTSLQASKLGRGVYEALGYQSFGPMNMWERRQPSA
jgi:GNAT superfamily N-acetyltransferase